ncbi:hypothetical protein F6B41_12835 [Microbacterium lushaniae]|nr:hypothetical protein F6B41_20045 [Microbacterium lushaniae]KAA9154547.1 hypothetical protein F6B41_12835 [Microbacterium lushaniae]
MLTVAVAVSGAVAATGCCLAPSRWRARALAAVMAAACVPLLTDTMRMAAALALLLLVLLLSVGLRQRSTRERAADVHRAIGGALMAGMLFVGGHGTGDLTASAHGHGVGLSPHGVFGTAAAAYVVWTVAALARRRHRPDRVAARVEAGAMAVMFALAVLSMGLS